MITIIIIIIVSACSSTLKQNRPRNDLLCVEWDVKPYSQTETLPHKIQL